MKAFLLAGGHGTRLRPLTDAVPKCLVPICGRPLLEIWLEICRRAGITEVLINLHAHSAAIEDFLRVQNTPVKVRVVQEKELLGSAGTVAANRAWVESEGAFWVLYADVLTNMSLRQMVEFHPERDTVATLGLYQAPNPSSCGVAELNGDGVIVGFEEKPATPRSKWTFCGVMLARRGLLDFLPPGAPADIGFHLLPTLVGRMQGYPVTDYLLDVGTISNYEKAQATWPGLPAGDAELLSTVGPRRPTTRTDSEARSPVNSACPGSKTSGPTYPSPRHRLRGVIFDMDGVLVDSHAAHRRAWRLFLDTLHCNVQESELDFILDGRKRIDILRHFLGDLRNSDLEEFGRQKDCIFREIQFSVLPVPGVTRLVDELRRGGTRLAVATSASRSRALSTLTELALLNSFEAVITGEEVLCGKPDPEIYRMATARLEIDAGDLIAIEDAVSGIQAAVGAGLACVAVALHRAPETLRAAGAATVISGFEGISFGDLDRFLLADDPVIKGDGRKAASPG